MPEPFGSGLTFSRIGGIGFASAPGQSPLLQSRAPSQHCFIAPLGQLPTPIKHWYEPGLAGFGQHAFVLPSQIVPPHERSPAGVQNAAPGGGEQVPVAGGVGPWQVNCEQVVMPGQH